MSKFRKTLSLAAATCIFATSATPAFAQVTGYVTQKDGIEYEYDAAELIASIMNGGSLYTRYLEENLVALRDDQKGLIDADDVINAIINSEGSFDVDNYTESGNAKPSTVVVDKKVSVDASGNVKEEDVVVNTDKEGPVLSYAGETTITVANGASFTAPSVTGTDNVDATVSVTKVIKNAAGTVLEAIDTKVAGTYTITYSAKDAAGNASNEIVITVTVEEAVQELKVESVSAINNKTIKVTFNKEVDQTTAETAGNYTLNRISTSTPNAITKAVLNLTDKKTVLLTTTTPTVATTNGYALEVANVKDTATPAEIIPTQEVIFSTVATADTEKPALFGASYESSTGKITLTFNKNISLTDANFDETGITVKGSSNYTLVEGDYTGASSSTGNTVTITLTEAGKAAVNALGTSLSLDVAAGSLKDAADITRTNDAISAYPLELTSAPGLSSAAYDENTSMLTLTFDKAVKVGDDIDLSKISVKRDGVSTALSSTNAEVTTTQANNVISIKLKGSFSHAGTTVISKVSLTAGAVKNVSGTDNLKIEDADLTYTDDTSKPTLASASYNSGTKLLTLKFSEVVDASTLTLANINITDGTNNFNLTSGNDSAVKTTVDGTEVVISLDNTNNGGGDYATIEGYDASELKVYFVAGTVKDLAANSIDEIKKANAVSISANDLVAPTFTMTDPSTISTKATVTFSEKVNKADAENVANYEIKSGAVVLPVTSASLLSDGVTVELTTGEQAGITYTTKISNVKDLAGNVIDDNVTQTFVGVPAATDAVQPSISTLKYEDTDGSKSISTGDKIKLRFDEPLNVDFTKVTYEDFLVAGSPATATSFGTGATFTAGDSSNEVVITLGSTPSIAFGNNVNVATTNDIKDLAGNIAQSSATALTNPGAAPLIESFSYADTNGSGDINTGDKLVITYDRNIDVTGAIAASDFTFGAGITATGATFAKTAANQITMTLGASSSVTLGATATIDEAVSTVITDEWGVAQVAADTNTETLKSADTVNPTLVSVTFDDANDDKVLDNGEKITIVMSEPVHKHTTFAAGDFVLYNGATAVPYAGKGGTATDGDNVAINGNIITITLGASDGWATKSVTTNTTFNFNAGTTSIKDASGNNAAPEAGFGKTLNIQ